MLHCPPVPGQSSKSSKFLNGLIYPNASRSSDSRLDVQVRDGENRSVLDLVDKLKDKIPNDASVAQRKFALERCTEILTGAAVHCAPSS